MSLIPKYIQSAETIAMEEVHNLSLLRLRIGELLIDFDNEIDLNKFNKWLECFGVPQELVNDDSFSALQIRKILKDLIKIKKIAGTEESVKLLALAMGATAVEIIPNNVLYRHNSKYYYNKAVIYDGGNSNGEVLRYNNKTRYNYNYHDKGNSSRMFAIDIKVKGVNDSIQFKINFKKVFYKLMPMRLWVREIILI